MLDRHRWLMLIPVALVVAAPLAARAQSKFDWTSNEPLTGEVVEGELFVEASEGGVYPLLVIEEPDVEPPQFQIDGTIRHEGVAGVAYLEMWTVLADESRYFTRTLAESGPLQYMTGTSEQRPFSLPFVLGEEGPVPIRLEINLVTEGSGRFWVGPLVITSSAAELTATTSSTQTAVTTGATDPVTTVAAGVTSQSTNSSGEGGLDETGLWWGLGVLVVAGVAASLGWVRSIHRRRAEEERRMNAMDSLRS